MGAVAIPRYEKAFYDDLRWRRTGWSRGPRASTSVVAITAHDDDDDDDDDDGGDCGSAAYCTAPSGL